MQLQKYPSRFHVRKVIEQFMNNKNAITFLQQKGIIVQARKSKDLAKISADHYFSRANFVELKSKIEAEHNYKKTGRISLPLEQLPNLKEALSEVNGEHLKDDENTKITVFNQDNGTLKFLIDYTEYKPGLIDLLDSTNRQIEVTINEQDDFCSLDFDTLVSKDYSKVKEVVKYITKSNEELELDFSEISLNMLNCEKRIQLFNDFFKFDHSPWEFVEIKKLKVKRDENETKSQENSITDSQLSGINSAIIDGKNLIENPFVKQTLENSFYFSMAEMRFENKENSQFIDMAIDFKSRPEKYETKITNSGNMVYEDFKLVEEISILDQTSQKEVLFQFNNSLYHIYRELIKERRVSFSTGKADVTFRSEKEVLKSE